MDKDNQEISTFLNGYEPAVRIIVQALRELMANIAPDAIEQMDIPAKMLAYSFARTYKDMVGVIMPLQDTVNLGFPRGASLPDPDGLLAGTGKRARHVKLHAVEDVANPALRTLLVESVRQIKQQKLP